MGCGYIRNDSLFMIGVVQIRHTGINKLGDGKGISWTARIWLNFNLQCGSTRPQ